MGPGVEDLGDEIEVDIAYVIDATNKVARLMEDLAEDLERRGGSTIRMPKLTNPHFPPWGQDPVGSSCGDRIDICTILDKVVLFLRMVCAGLNRS
jgi:hypothetical protein